MKIIFILLDVLFLFLLAVSVSYAVTCANGVYRAGCANANGAVVVKKAPPAAVVVNPKPVVVAPPVKVVTPAVQCAWVNGRKVC